MKSLRDQRRAIREKREASRQRLTLDHVKDRGGRVAVAGRTLLPQDAFDFARQLCDAAYTAQGGPVEDPDERYKQLLAREARTATWFEELYCRIRDIAADFH